MSRRDTSGKFARRHSSAMVVVTWLGSFLSAGLLCVVARAVAANFGSFRSCDTNSSGLYISSCGKQSLNLGDLMLLLLFILSASLTVSLFTVAWRMVRGTRK